jgi:hypothetical protein
MPVSVNERSFETTFTPVPSEVNESQQKTALLRAPTEDNSLEVVEQANNKAEQLQTALEAVPFPLKPLTRLLESLSSGESMYQMQLAMINLRQTQSVASTQSAELQSHKVKDATREFFEAAFKYLEYQAKLAEMQGMNVFEKLGKVLAACFAILMAATSIAVTGGLSSPAAVLTMVVAMGALVDMCSMISQEHGGPAFTVSTGLKETVLAVARDFMSEEDAQKFAQLMTGILGSITGMGLADPTVGGQLMSGIAQYAGASDMVAGILNTVGTLITGIAAGALTGTAVNQAVKGAKAAADVANVAAKAGQGTIEAAQTAEKAATIGEKITSALVRTTTINGGQIVSGAVNGGLGVAGGVLNLERAEVQNTTEEAGADDMRARGNVDEQTALFEIKVGHQKTLEELLYEIMKTLQEALHGMEDAKLRMARAFTPTNETV